MVLQLENSQGRGQMTSMSQHLRMLLSLPWGSGSDTEQEEGADTLGEVAIVCASKGSQTQHSQPVHYASHLIPTTVPQVDSVTLSLFYTWGN